MSDSSVHGKHPVGPTPKTEFTPEEKFRSLVFDLDSIDTIREDRLEKLAEKANHFIKHPQSRLERFVTFLADSLKSFANKTSSLFQKKAWKGPEQIARKELKSPPQTAPSPKTEGLRGKAGITKSLARAFFKNIGHFLQKERPSLGKRVSKNPKIVGATDTKNLGRKILYPPRPYGSATE